MIGLDEHFEEAGLEDAIRQWYHGRVCVIGVLRPVNDSATYVLSLP